MLIPAQASLAMSMLKVSAELSLSSSSDSPLSSVGLSKTLDDVDLDSFFTPAYQLPPSFHTANFESAWRAQDVYQEKASQTREAARFRILDPVC